MDNEVKKELAEVESLQLVRKNLETEIAKLNTVLNNIDAQAHTAQVKDEQDKGIQNAEKMNAYAAEERRIELKRIEAEKRIDIAETIERNAKDRLAEVERREQKSMDLEIKIADLNNQRSNFEIYKTGVENDLVKAKEIIAESNEVFGKIAMEKEMLSGREAKVKIQEKYWNDEIGKLEADKKQFQIEKENFIGLHKQPVEVVNG